MEQFSLEEHLKNPSRKVVTRSGHNVRILCTDQRGNMPIVALVEFETLDGVQLFYSDGKNESHREYDLFLADEEEDEFETTMISFSHAMFDHLLNSTNVKVDVKEWKNKFLDLARKELEKDIEHSAVEFAKSYMEDVNPSFEKVKESEELWKWKMSCLRGLNKAYTQGKQDALKDLPKWKKITDETNLSLTLSNGEYYLLLQDLETLPKEE